MKHGESDGGWRGVACRRNESDILTTLMALDALRRAGVPADHSTIVKGEAALIRAQHPTGYWMVEGIWEEFPTCLAVEYLRSRLERGALPNKYLVSAKGLIEKSAQLVLTGEIADAKLAVVSAYHGLEHLLYGLMLLKDDQASVFRGSETVGFREALTSFLGVAQRFGAIEQGKKLPLDTQLRDLASVRDHAVHQAVPITSDDAEKHLEHVRRFIRRFDTKMLGFPLLD